MMRTWYTLLLLLLPTHVYANQPNIIATIRPLHALVQSVVGESATVQLLLNDSESVHSVQLKPSHMRTMLSADIVFYIAPEFEPFMAPAIENFDASTRAVSMAESKNLILYPQRKQAIAEDTEEHNHHAHDHHNHAAMDYHIWLSPANAIAMLYHIEKQLSTRFPDNASVYHTNTTTAVARIQALDAALKAKLQPHQTQPFIVLHDAFQYLEREYQLHNAGALSSASSTALSANSMQSARQLITTHKVRCVVSDPSTSARVQKALVQDANIHTTTIDTIGYAHTPSSELYIQLMLGIANQLTLCLAPAE